jgi:hypothetical protein
MGITTLQIFVATKGLYYLSANQELTLKTLYKNLGWTLQNQSSRRLKLFPQVLQINKGAMRSLQNDLKCGGHKVCR